jgi:hypothetical protein
MGPRVTGCGIEKSSKSTDREVVSYEPIGGAPEQLMLGRRICG